MEILSKEEDGVLVTEFPQTALWPREHPSGLDVSVSDRAAPTVLQLSFCLASSCSEPRFREY